MTVKSIISTVLGRINSKFGGFPDRFVFKLKVSPEPMRTGGRETRAHVVSCGEAKLLIEYSSEFDVADLDGIRIVRDVSYDIPALSRGRDVRYYLHGNMGCINWAPFIDVVRDLEGEQRYLLMPADWERYLRRRD